MDYNAFLGSPEGLVIMIVAIAGAAAFLLIRTPGGKKEPSIAVLERKQASTATAGGLSSIYLVRPTIRKSNQNKEIKAPDGAKFTLDDDKMRMADTLIIPKKLSLPKGVYRIIAREGGNLTLFGKSLANTSSLMLDNADMTRIINRRSLILLAKGAGGAISENILYIVLALMAGVSVGWVIYPYFNHVAPIIEYCTHLPNGTVVPVGCPG